MAFDIFLKLESPAGKALSPAELKGETTDKAFAGAIQLNSFSFGVENQITIGSASGGAGTGKAAFKELEITKHVDSVSPALFKALCMGAHFGDAWLYIRKAGAVKGATAQAYITIRLKMMFVTNIEFTGSSDDDLPGEKVTFKYGAMEISYKQQDATGKAGAEIKAMWSQIKNAAVLE